MVKVLCKGGPYYWIREPRTDFEKKMEAVDRAEDVRERTAKGWIKQHGDFELAALANDPVPPPTKDERKRWKREYPDKYFLLPAEIYPREVGVDPPSHFETAFANVKHITFYGGAPHRPTPPSAPQKAPVAQRRKRR